MKIKKIAVLVEALNSKSGSRAPIEIAKGLNRRGYDISIYSYSQILDRQLKKSLERSGIRVFIFEKSNLFVLGKIMPDKKIVSQLKKEKTEIAMCAAFFPMLVSAKFSKSHVINLYMGTQFDAYLEKLTPGKSPNLKEQILNFAANTAIYSLELASVWISDYLIAISKYCAEEIQKLYFKKPTSIIYLGGDHLTSIKGKANKHSLKLISVSRIVPYKRFHTLLEVMKNFDKKEVSLTIAGSTPDKKYLKYLKNRHSDNVILVPNPTDRELSKLYSDADAYLSADQHLFFGMPPVEASFFSVPTIALKSAASDEIISSGKTGFVIKNTDQMIEKINLFKKNRNVTRKMGTAALKRSIGLFTWRKTIDDYERLFQKIKSA